MTITAPLRQTIIKKMMLIVLIPNNNSKMR